jgi:hypothetical protein
MHYVPEKYPSSYTTLRNNFNCYRKFRLIGIVESNRVHSALRSLTGLLCQPRVIMMMEKLVEW